MVEPDPEAIVVVALPRAGLVTRLHVRLGERVSAGDPLLALDTAPGTRMQYSQADAAYAYAKGQLARTQQLFDEQLATRDQVASAERALRDAESQLNALQKIGANQNQQTIRASTDGIVTGLSVNAGDRIAADTPAMFLAQSSGLIVRLGVEPEDAKRIPDDAPVTLISIFDAEIKIDTQLEKINAMINPATRLVDAIAPVPPAQADRITLGSTMRADILLAEMSAEIVPRSAVLRDQDGAYVYTVNGSKAQRVNVTVVYESANETGIQSTLPKDAVVVISGNYELSDGMSVRAKNSGTQ